MTHSDCFGDFRARWFLVALILIAAAPVQSAIVLLYDAEPNDSPQQAVKISLPDGSDVLRIMGELDGQDQDAYRLVVDEDHAGRRFNLRLTGRAGALTQLDVFDFTAAADGRGRIPETLTERPGNPLTLKALDGGRAVQAEAVLLPPGVYVLGVSQSSGQGAYTVELEQNDYGSVRVVDEDNSVEDPVALSPNGKQVVWTQGETWIGFDLDEDEAARAWGLTFQGALGHSATAELQDADGEVLLSLTSDGTGPVLRPGLSLPAGDYRIRTEQAEAGVQWIALPRGTPVSSDGREAEPNDREPTTIAFGETIRGRFDESDTDMLRFEVDEEAAAKRWNLAVEGGLESKIELCLQRIAMKRLQHCNRGEQHTEKFALGFAPGEYTLRLSDSGPDGVDWQLTWTDLGPIRPGEEVEPNDHHEHAAPLHDRGFGRGRFDGRETDHWRFNVTGDPQLWRVQVQGDDLHELYLKQIGGATIASERAAQGQTRVRLENQFLLPGEYLIAASGTDADYTLRVQPLGPPPEGMELEPNNELSDGRRMRFGQEYFGLMAEDGDTDVYRFTLLGDEQVRLRVMPPADGTIRTRLTAGDDATTIVELRRNREPGVASEWTGYLPPGEYGVFLSPNDPSDAEYRVVLERRDWLEPVSDREPNDWRALAAPFPPDGRLIGRVGNSRASADWYRLPPVDAPTPIALPRVSGLRLRIYEGDRVGDNLFDYDHEAGLERAELQPGGDYRLEISGNLDYDIDLTSLASTEPGVAPEVELAVDDVAVQAFSPWSQRIGGTVTVRNPADVAETFRLTAHLTARQWTLSGLPESIRLDPGESSSIPVTLEIAPDAVERPDVQLSVRASDGAASAGAVATVRTDIDAAAVEPAFHWDLDQPLRGGFNAAALRFGAEVVASPNIDDDDLDDFHPLFDGLTRYGRWVESSIRTGADGPDSYQQPTVRLAGDALVPVQGFLLDPTSTIHPNRILREFAVALSLDGQTFDTVLRGELAAQNAEQAFVLDAPVPARYARLMPITGSLGDTRQLQVLKLGEFKVIAAEDWQPPGAPYDLADPVNGGHLVWAEPWIRASGGERSLFASDDESPSPPMRNAEAATVVMGFEHARIARIDGVAIEPMAAEVSGGTNPVAVRVAVATRSPLGPWTSVDGAGTELTDQPVELAFDAPLWARYVKLEFEVPEGIRSVKYPDRIRVFEAPGDSVLGEWGHYAHVGPYEAVDPPVPPAVATRPDNDSRAAARPVRPGAPEPGRALLDDYASWYRLSSTGTENRLELTLTGRPTIEGAPRLVDAAGEEVALYPLENDGVEARWEAWIEPGAEYFLEVHEPPRSVIFSWDTSGSVAAWLPTITNALLTYAETIKPGRDEVNLLPFGRSEPLLANWQGHPYPLMRMLAADPQETSSSDAERTLAVAARAMVGRPGKKAVLLLTDAATSTSAELWPALREGRPQVFAMKLTSEGAFSSNPDIELDLMQDWAMVRGGHFEYITGLGALARGFDRAVAWLKRPVDFEVEVAFETVEDPSPATIAVEAGDAGVAPEARGAVEIILDASGSMLKRMNGTRRIEIAKAAIRDTVQSALPDGIPLALRVYGHREAGSCRTDLEVPLAPLDKAAFLATVSEIQAINLARTPIADSLAAVASDLGDAEGRRLVILLTDGEETCEGDPAAAIEALAAQGVDLRVNIVGFAIDDEALKDEFRSWAELGGGDYLDAGEAEALGEALEQSLRIPFDVIDGSGEVVAGGFVGEAPVEVPAGDYSVRIRAATDRWIRDLQLAPGDERVVSLDD